MSDGSQPVGYGRPPEHTRFQKGQSGNPSGTAGPKKKVRQAFETALSKALSTGYSALRETRSTTMIEAIANEIVFQALKGSVADRRFAVSLINDQLGGRGEEPGLPSDGSSP